MYKVGSKVISDIFKTLTIIFLAFGHFVHPCKEEAIIKLSSADQVPMFNAPIYLENKQQIGKINEVFGPINEIVNLHYFINHLISKLVNHFFLFFTVHFSKT